MYKYLGISLITPASNRYYDTIIKYKNNNIIEVDKYLIQIIKQMENDIILWKTTAPNWSHIPFKSVIYNNNSIKYDDSNKTDYSKYNNYKCKILFSYIAINYADDNSYCYLNIDIDDIIPHSITYQDKFKIEFDM